MRKLEKLLTKVMEQYEGGLPLHLIDSDRSAVATMSESEFLNKTAGEIQEVLRYKHILISDCASQPLEFDKDGLRTLCPPWETIEVQGEVLSFILVYLIDGNL
jgi:hypothetical protein